MVNNLFAQLEKSVFIITYGRSGSTLLQNLLNSLPGYTIRGENENLLAQMVRAWNQVRLSEQGHKMREAGHPSTPQNPWFGYEAVDEETLGTTLARCFAETVLRPDESTRVTGFKEIRWHADPTLFPAMLAFLRRFFPDARFIFNTRDHDQVVRSGWWKYMREDVVRRQLTQAEALYAAYAEAHPGHCITMRYAAYVSDQAQWKPLFDFLGEPFDRDLVTAVLENKLQHLQNV